MGSEGEERALSHAPLPFFLSPETHQECSGCETAAVPVFRKAVRQLLSRWAPKAGNLTVFGPRTAADDHRIGLLYDAQACAPSDNPLRSSCVLPLCPATIDPIACQFLLLHSTLPRACFSASATGAYPDESMADVLASRLAIWSKQSENMTAAFPSMPTSPPLLTELHSDADYDLMTIVTSLRAAARLCRIAGLEDDWQGVVNSLAVALGALGTAGVRRVLGLRTTLGSSFGMPPPLR